MLEASGALSYDQVYLDALSSTGKVLSCLLHHHHPSRSPTCHFRARESSSWHQEDWDGRRPPRAR